MKQDTKLRKEKEREEEALILEKLKVANHAYSTKVIIFSHFSFFQFFKFTINYSVYYCYHSQTFIGYPDVNRSEAAAGGVLQNFANFTGK